MLVSQIAYTLNSLDTFPMIRTRTIWRYGQFLKNYNITRELSQQIRYNYITRDYFSIS